MKKKDPIFQDQSEVPSEEAKNFQNLVDKVLSVSKKEIDKREAENKKRKANGN